MAENKWDSKSALDFAASILKSTAKPAPVFKAPKMPPAPKVDVSRPGAFSSMAIPTETMAKAKTAKPKATPWEERQDSVRRLSVKHQLVPEDQTLLDSFLYANRETRTGAKISPIESKATAPAFLVTQKAVNKANSLLRTPEGRATMAAEVAKFKAQRAMLAANRINQQFAPRVAQAPTLQDANITPAESARLSAQAEADRAERSFRTGTETGRMMANVQAAAETINKAFAPASRGLAAVASAVTPLGLSPSYRKGVEELVMSLPGGTIMAIPQGLVDLMTTVDPDNRLDPTKRLQTALGTVLNLGGSAIGAATLGDDVAKASKILTNAMARGAKVIPAAESNAARLLVKQGPPLPTVEPVIPKPAPESVRPILPIDTPDEVLYRAENLTGKPRGQGLGKGVYATGHKPLAESYAEAGAVVKPYRVASGVKLLDTESPEYDALFTKHWTESSGVNNETLAAEAKTLGYGGIRQSIPGSGEAAQVVVFDKSNLIPVEPTLKPAPAAATPPVTAPKPPKAPKVIQSPVGAPEMMVESGGTYPTAQGPTTTPVPKLKGTAIQRLRQIDDWLVENASMVASDTRNEWMQDLLRGVKRSSGGDKRLTEADREMLNEYLFGDAVEIPKPLTRPLSPDAPKVKPAPVVAEKAVQAAQKEPWQMTRDEWTSSPRKWSDAPRDMTLDEWRAANNRYTPLQDQGMMKYPHGISKAERSRIDKRYARNMADLDASAKEYAKLKADGALPQVQQGRWIKADGLDLPGQTAAARVKHKRDVFAAVKKGKPVPAEVLADYPDLAPKPVQAAPEPIPAQPTPKTKPTPADASARATARADKAFRAKHGVGLGDEVTITYPNGKVQEGVLDHTPKTGWRIKGDAVTEKTFESIKPKAQAVEAVASPELSPSPIVRQSHEGAQSAPGVKGKHGMTKGQASSLVAQIDEYAKSGAQGRASFDIPKDGTFTVDNLRQASNLRHEFAGEGIQGLPKIVTGAKVTMPEGREWKVKSVSGDSVTLVPPQSTPGSKAWDQEYTVDASVFKREAPTVASLSSGRTGKRVQIIPWKKDGTREVPVQAERITGNGIDDANLAGRKSGDGYSIYDVATGESVISRPTKDEAIETVDRLVATKFDGDAKKLAEEIKLRHSGLRGDKAIVSPTAPVSPKVEAPAIPAVPKPAASGMEGLADKLAQRKTRLQDELAKAPKAIKGKQAGATFGPERLAKEVDLFLTSAAEAAIRKGISLTKAIQELVMAEGRDADDLAAINKALPKWADEVGVDASFINGTKSAEKGAQEAIGLPDVMTDAVRLARKELPTYAPAASAEKLAAKGVPDYRADTAGTARMVQNAVADGRVMDESEVARAAAYYVDLNNQQTAAYAKLNKAGLSEADRDETLALLNSIEAEMGVAEEAAQLVKTKFHNLGEALQILLTPKYDFVSMKNNALRANLGQNLTDIQTSVIRDQAQSIGELEGSVSELKTKLRKRTAKAVASLDPQVKDAEAAWAKAFTEHEDQKARLRQIQKETRGNARQAKNLEARVARAKAKLDAAQSRLDEAVTAAESIPEAPRASRTTRTASPVTGKVMRQRGASILQRLGLYKVGADVPDFVSGGMKSKRSGAVSLPGSEKDQEAMARGVRMMIRGFVEDAANAGLPPLTTGEAVDMLKADPNFMLDEDQVYALLSGQFRTAKLEANVQKMAADRLLRAFREDANYKALPKFLKGAMILKDAALTLPRATVFSGDLSALLNQGGKALMYGYAKEWGQSLAPMMKAIKGGEKEFLRQFGEIQSLPIYPRAVKAGLDMTEAGSLTKAEEVFASGLMDTWAKLGERSNPILKALSIPAQVVKRSEYAYTTFLNSLRIKMFEKLAKLNPDDASYLKDMAGFVNVITGRGSLQPKNAGLARGASHFLIAPRFYLSQAQDLVGLPLWKALASKDKIGAKVTAKYYASKALAYGLIAAFAKNVGWELDSDPRSNGFGRILHKGMGVDVNLFGQDLQWIRPMVQAIYGTVSKKGNYMSPFQVGYSRLDPTWNLMKRKLVPSVNIGLDIATRETYDFKSGEIVPFTMAGSAKALLPISIRDTADAVAAKDPAFKSAAKIILNMLGLQVNDLKKPSGDKIPPLDFANPPKRKPKKA